MLKIKMIDRTIYYSNLDLYEFNKLLNSNGMFARVKDENYADIIINKYQIVSIKED